MHAMVAARSCLPAMAFAATLLAAVAYAQGVSIAPGGGSANTTGIGSGLGDPRGTGPHYPNGTTQPTLPSPVPPPPGGWGVAPTAPSSPSLSTVRPPSYLQPTAPFGPPVSGPSGPLPPGPPLRLPDAPAADLSFLKGCWRSDIFQQARQRGVATYCFDANGAGRFLYKRLDTLTFSCEGAAQAAYVGSTLRLHGSGMSCSDGHADYPADLDCARDGNGAARCTVATTGGDGAGSWTVGLRRAR